MADASPNVPSIEFVRSTARKHSLRRCVVLFETQQGQVGYTSYGETKELCNATRDVMDEVFDDIEHRIQWDSSRLDLNNG